MRPGANRRDHRILIKSGRFNEARRESPGSRRGRRDTIARRRRFNEARRESPGSRTRYRKLHHKQMRSTLRALAERPRCNT